MNGKFFISLLFTPIFLLASELSPEWLKKSDKDLARTYLDGVSYLEMKNVWKCAPPLVKGAALHLVTPERYNSPEHRSLILYGPSGSGKSTMAKAIGAYANFDVISKRPNDFQNGKRSETGTKFANFIQGVVDSDVPTVVVIDEFNGLMEHFESENYDSAETSAAIWTTIDKLKGNNKIFIVMTANRVHKVPKQIKTRSKMRSCEIILGSNIEDRYGIFKDIFEQNEISMTMVGNDGKGNDNVFKDILKRHKSWNGRDLTEFVWAFKQVWMDEPGLRPDTSNGESVKKFVLEIEKRCKKQEDDWRYEEEELSSEDRQDLYQAQNIWAQVIVQRLQKIPMLFRSPGINRTVGNFIINSVLNKNQSRLAKMHMNVNALQAEHALDLL